MEPIGKLPVPAPLLVPAKLALFLCWIYPLAGGYRVAPAESTGGAVFAAGIVLYALGAVVGTLSFSSLGRSLAVGLPRSATELKTGGAYRFSRNPIYLAAYLLCAGSCVVAPHPLNIGLFAFAAVVHHRIILSEERFLEERFGDDYRAYKRRVRRYL